MFLISLNRYNYSGFFMPFYPGLTDIVVLNCTPERVIPIPLTLFPCRIAEISDTLGCLLFARILSPPRLTAVSSILYTARLPVPAGPSASAAAAFRSAARSGSPPLWRIAPSSGSICTIHIHSGQPLSRIRCPSFLFSFLCTLVFSR